MHLLHMRKGKVLDNLCTFPCPGVGQGSVENMHVPYVLLQARSKSDKGEQQDRASPAQ
jgi:hypothetical protein